MLASVIQEHARFKHLGGLALLVSWPESAAAYTCLANCLTFLRRL